MQHTITTEEISAMYVNEELAGHFNSKLGIYKKLWFSYNLRTQAAHFEVEIGLLITEYATLDEAVKAYNNG